MCGERDASNTHYAKFSRGMRVRVIWNLYKKTLAATRKLVFDFELYVRGTPRVKNCVTAAVHTQT